MTCYQSTSLPSGVTPTGRTAYSTEADCLNACKEGACCDGTTCSVKPQCQCQGTGKKFFGVGTVCTPNPCAVCACKDPIADPHSVSRPDTNSESVSLADADTRIKLPKTLTVTINITGTSSAVSFSNSTACQSVLLSILNGSYTLTRAADSSGCAFAYTATTTINGLTANFTFGKHPNANQFSGDMPFLNVSLSSGCRNGWDFWYANAYMKPGDTQPVGFSWAEAMNAICDGSAIVWLWNWFPSQGNQLITVQSNPLP